MTLVICFYDIDYVWAWANCFRIVIFTVRKRSLGQGNILHLSVSHSVDKGRWWWNGCGERGVCRKGGVSGTPRPSGRYPWIQRQTPPVETAVEAGSTHPTGMYSCWKINWQLQLHSNFKLRATISIYLTSYRQKFKDTSIKVNLNR